MKNAGLASALLFFLLIVSCGRQDPPKATTVFSGNSMTIDYKIIVGKSLTDLEASSVQKVIGFTFHEVDWIYNKWNPESELSHLNQLPAQVKVRISAELLNLLQITDQIVVLSEGRFDPTIESVQQLWKSKLSAGKIPSNEEIEEVSSMTGWNKIHFEGGIFYKEKDGIQLDLGGIAKGHCIDLLVERISDLGCNDLLVEWGGEMRGLGMHPEGRPWQIYISHFSEPKLEKALDRLGLTDQAIATSGDYMQNWKVGDATYFHIIDPRTFHPLQMSEKSIASTSVLAPTCAIADGLATAAMLFNTPDEAWEWTKRVQKQLPSTRFWIVAHNQD
jgi:thiamine biosynthesis lipoprotein